MQSSNSEVILDFKELLQEAEEDGFELETLLDTYEDFVSSVEEGEWTKQERDVINTLLNQARDLITENGYDLDDLEEELREPEQIYVVDEEDILEALETNHVTNDSLEESADGDTLSIEELEGATDNEEVGFIDRYDFG